MKVICLINTRNHARFIDECVRSCLAQTIPEDCVYAVHAVDAGSTDGTLEKLEATRGRMTIHARDNIGQSGAFDLCLQLEADIIMFCDGDDRLHPDRLRMVVEAFQRHPDVVLVGNSINEVDKDGAQIRRVYVENDCCLDVNAGDAELLYGARCLLGTSRMAVRKKLLEKILPFDQTVLFEADEYIFSLLPSFGKVYILAAGLTDYRLHGTNNYQNARPSLERMQRYRQVHEALLAAMLSCKNRLGVAGAYMELCEAGLEKLCVRLAVVEHAFQSRKLAFGLLMRMPEVIGLVRGRRPIQLLYSALVWVFGLRACMLAQFHLKQMFGRFLFRSNVKEQPGCLDCNVLQA